MTHQTNDDKTVICQCCHAELPWHERFECGRCRKVVCAACYRMYSWFSGCRECHTIVVQEQFRKEACKHG